MRDSPVSVSALLCKQNALSVLCHLQYFKIVPGVLFFGILRVRNIGLSEHWAVSERDAPVLVVPGSSFHQHGTTNENSLDCCAFTDGSAKRRSLDERSVLGVTFALTRAFR